MKPVTCSDPTLGRDDKSTVLLDLPAFSEETCRLMESPAPTFQQQLAHAAMLLRWQQARGLQADRMDGNPRRFSLSEDGSSQPHVDFTTEVRRTGDRMIDD